MLGDVVGSATRTVRIDEGAVVIEDRWRGGAADFAMTARLHTSAAVTVAADGRSATWRQDGRTLAMTLAGAPQSRIVVRPADELLAEWDRELPGVTAVDVLTPTAASTDTATTVRLELVPR